MSHPKRPRLRRIAKCTGLVACVLIVVAWGVSLKWGVRYTSDDRGTAVACGVISILHSPGGPPRPTEWSFLHMGRSDRDWGHWGFKWPRTWQHPMIDHRERYIPLWLPLVVLAIPTAFLWHRDRRRIPPGHCRQCGYDLTGNESGKCPECGEPCGLARSER